MADYYRTKDRLPTAADADRHGMVITAGYGGPWYRTNWEAAQYRDLWRPCRPSDYAPEKPREPRRETWYAVWDKKQLIWCYKHEQSAVDVARIFDGHYHPVEIIEQLPEGDA